MKLVRNLSVKVSALAALAVIPLSVFADTPVISGATNFPSVSNAAPSLSTILLILLSLLLMTLVFRLSKQKVLGDSFFMLLGASVLIASTGSIKLISDLQDNPTLANMSPQIRTVDVFSGQLTVVKNDRRPTSNYNY